MAASRWTEGALLREMIAVLKRPDTRMHLSTLPDCRACCEWDGKGENVDIHVDVFQYGLIPGAIHELYHYLARGHLEGFTEELAETQVDGVEGRLWAYLAKRPYIEKRWRREIAKKVQKEDDP